MITKEILKYPTSPYSDVVCPYCDAGHDACYRDLDEGVYNDNCITCGHNLKLAVTMYPNGIRLIHQLTYATPLEHEIEVKRKMDKLARGY